MLEGATPTRSCGEPSSAQQGPHVTTPSRAARCPGAAGMTYSFARRVRLSSYRTNTLVLFLAQRTSLFKNLINTGFLPQDIESL